RAALRSSVSRYRHRATRVPVAQAFRPARVMSKRLRSRNPLRYDYLQESLLAREVIGDCGFGREQADAGEQEIPPEALALLRLFAGHFLRLLRFGVHGRGVAGYRCDQLARIDRVEVGLGRVEIHGD